MLVKKYNDFHCGDIEVLITIRKVVDASLEPRSKKQLIEAFTAGINDIDDVINEWNDFVSVQREAHLKQIILKENIKPEETKV